MAKTRTVFNRVKRFLFVGRMEAKKLQSARQETLETITEIVQRRPVTTIAERFL